MSQKKNRSGSPMVTGARAGTFHFAPFGSRQFRLVAVLFNGDRRQLHVAPTVGDLWRRPWLVSAELESDVVDLRVEVQVDRNGKAAWKPLGESFSGPRDDQD